MPIQIRKKQWEKPLIWLVVLTTAQWVLSVFLYIPLVLSPVLWGTLTGLSVLMTAVLLAVPDSGGVGITARVLWCFTLAVRWFAAGWCVYECLFLGYDAESRLDTVASVAAVIGAIFVTMMPMLAISVAVGCRHGDGMLLLVGSVGYTLLAIFLHGVEPLAIGTVLRLTETAPAFVAVAVDLAAVGLAVCVTVAAFFACPPRMPKPETNEKNTAVK